MRRVMGLPDSLTMAQLPEYLRSNHRATLRQWQAGGEAFTWLENYHAGRARAKVRSQPSVNLDVARPMQVQHQNDNTEDFFSF